MAAINHHFSPLPEFPLLPRGMIIPILYLTLEYTAGVAKATRISLLLRKCAARKQSQIAIAGHLQQR